MIESSDGYIATGIVGLLFTGLIGWMAIGLSYTERESYNNAKITEIVKGKHITMIIFDDPCNKNCDNSIVTYKDFVADKIDSTTKFEWCTHYNIYGSEISHIIHIKK